MDSELIPAKSFINLEGLMNLFLRILALVFIFFAIRYWMMLVGVLDDNIRFDIMPNNWKVASALLSVLYPIAALGLWGLASWGIVVWFMTALVELVMFFGFPELFGEAKLLIIMHVACFAVWLVYQLIQFIISRYAQIKKARQA